MQKERIEKLTKYIERLEKVESDLYNLQDILHTITAITQRAIETLNETIDDVEE